jgi:hypothetical protein
VLRTQAHVMHVSCVRTGILSGYEIMNIYIDMNIIHQILLTDSIFRCKTLQEKIL